MKNEVKVRRVWIPEYVLADPMMFKRIDYHDRLVLSSQIYKHKLSTDYVYCEVIIRPLPKKGKVKK